MLRFDKQPSFELGVIAFEVCAGCHPIEDYLTAEKNMRGYTAADIADLPDVYPGEFTTLLKSLVTFEPGVLIECHVYADVVLCCSEHCCYCMVASAAQRPTIAEAATRLSTLRQSLYGSDVTIARLRDALRRAHERMVRVTGCCVSV